MKYKIIIAIIIIYAIIIGGLLIIKEMNKTQLVLFPDTVLEYDGKKWKQVELNQDKKYNIYIDNKFVKKSSIKNNNGEITIDGETVYNYLASNKEIIPVDFIVNEITEDEKNEILKQANIKSDFITVSNKIDIDYDKDGQIETLYFLANSYNGSSKDKMFTLIYVKDEISEFVLKETYSSEKNARACDLDSIINVNGKNRFIVRCPGFSDSGIKVKMYEVKNNKLTIVADI